MEGQRRTRASAGSGRRLELVETGSAALRLAGTENAPRGPLLVPGMQIGAGVLAAGLATAALVIGLSIDPLQPLDVVRAIAEALAIGLSVAAGLYALRRPQSAPFARLLVLTGLGFAPVMLALLDEPVPYGIGRIWGWMVLAGIIYLLLAFPVGHLVARRDRWIAGSALALVLLLYLPTVLFAEFPVPSPWTACGSSCPSNAFQITSNEPGFVSVLVNLRDYLGIAVYAAAATAVALRLARSSQLSRRVHG